MSLRVWLPLTGTLENKGCSDLTFSYSGSNIVVNDNGKIGKCYRRITKASDAIISNKAINLGTNQSMFCWIKVDSFNSGASLTGILGLHRYSTNTGMGITLRYASASTGYASVNTGNGSSRTYNSYYGATALNANTWYHIGYTYDGSNIRIYVNGNLDKIQAFTGMSCPADYILIGAWSFTGSSGTGIDPYSTPEYINDVRIYDHCLSAAEVKEISLGLVLHYKLDGFLGGFGNPNLVAGSNTDSTSTNKWGASSAVGGNTSTIVLDENGHTCVLITRDATAQSSWDYLWYSNLLHNLIKTNTTYTISFDCKPSVDGSIGFTGFINGNATNYMTTSTSTILGTCYANLWNHMIYRCTTKSSFSDISVGGQVVYFSRSGSLRGVNTTVLFKNMKVEEGTIDTPWCPADSELTIDRAHILDSSGYGHNGSCVNTTITSSEARFDNCMSCLGTSVDNSSNTITGASFFYCNIDVPLINTITIAWWGKNTAYGRGGIFETSASTLTDTNKGSDYNTTAIANWDSTFRVYNGSSQVNIFSNFNKDGNWHHHTITYDGANVKYYCDGTVKLTTALTGNLPTWKSFCMGLGRAGGVWRLIKQYVSDLRIYVTALSIDDILSLYHTSAKIDNLGNWHTFEFKENNGIAKITKMGITEANEIYDNMNFNNRAQIVKTNAKVLIAGDLNIVTTYSSSVKTGTMPSLPGATVQALAGKTLRFIYDVYAPGTRYSAELGLTAWSYTRYGIHGSCTMDGSTSYPFADRLNYTGNGIHAIQTWTIPTGKSSYGALGFSVQNFDKPASTNNATWFIRNVRLELVDGTSENITGTQLIER